MRSLQPNHGSEGDPTHVSRNCNPTAIIVKDHQLEVVNQFTYLSSTSTNNLSLVVELDKRISKVATIVSKLSKKVCENRQPTVNSKVAVYKTCVISTLLYGSQSLTSYTAQERKLNNFRLRYLRRVLGVTNNEVLDIARYICIPNSANAAYDGLDMYIGWRMDTFQKPCCMVSWTQGTEIKVVHNFVTKTCGPKNGLHQLGIPGRQQRLGNKNCHPVAKKANSLSKKPLKRNA